MPVEVVGVKDVLKGLEFIDEDMRQRIRIAIDPLMRVRISSSINSKPLRTSLTPTTSTGIFDLLSSIG